MHPQPFIQTVFLLLIILANFGLGFAVVKLSKDMEVSGHTRLVGSC
jgi:hypothetical protein